ncbi:MAG: hypothetical protein ACTJLM_04505 [Ehrlichia sp.]
MLNFKLAKQNLYSREGLIKLDNIFLSYLQSSNKDLFDFLIKARRGSTESHTSYIIEISYIVEEFISKLFMIENEIKLQQNIHKEFLEIYKCKRLFIQRYALKKYPNIDNLNILDITQKNSKNIPITYSRKKFCKTSFVMVRKSRKIFRKFRHNSSICCIYGTFTIKYRKHFIQKPTKK